MYKVEVSYSVVLMYPTLEAAKKAMDILFEGGGIMKAILAWTTLAAAWFGFGFMVMTTMMTV